MTKTPEKGESFEEFQDKRVRLSEMADSIGTVIDVVVQATEGLITDQELCNRLEQMTGGKIEREKDMPHDELINLEDICNQFISHTRSFKWTDICVAMIKIDNERNQLIIARIIAFGLRSDDPSNV